MKKIEITDKKRSLIMLTLIIGGFSTLLCETLLNIAIPTIMNHFNIAATTAQWLVSGFIMTLGILMPCSGFLIQNFSTRRLFFGAILIFIFGGLFSACAVNFPMVLIGRLIQAAGISILIPLNQTTILAIYPPEKLGAANGLFILVLMFAPIVGPTTSGFVLQFFSWHALFLITIPFNILALIIAYFNLENVNEISHSKPDLISLLLSGIGFGGLIIGLNQASECGLGNIRSYLPLLAGILGLILFTIRQLRSSSPMLNLKILSSPLMAASVLFILFNTSCTFGNLILMPIFLQKALMMTAFSAGLLLLPTSLASALASPLSGRLYDAFGPRLLIPAGFLMIITTFISFNFLSTGIDHLLLILLICGISIGVSFIAITVNTHALKYLPAKERIDGSVILNTIQQIAASLGSSVFVSLMAVGSERYLSFYPNAGPVPALVSGLHFAYMLGLIPLIAGFVLSLFVGRFTAQAEKKLEISQEKI